MIAFSHYGTIRALIAELLGLTDEAMMHRDIPNGEAFLFERTTDAAGKQTFKEGKLSDHVLEPEAPPIQPPPAAPPR